MLANIKTIQIAPPIVEPNEIRISMQATRYSVFSVEPDMSAHSYNTWDFRYICYIDSRFMRLICRELNKIAIPRDRIPIILIDTTYFPLVVSRALLEDYLAVIGRLSTEIAKNIIEYDLVPMCAGIRAQCVILFNYNTASASCSIIDY